MPSASSAIQLPGPERRQDPGLPWSKASTPTFETIADKIYPVSRPLFFYVKNAHVGVIPGIKEFVAELTSESATGEDGYLADKGLIPLPARRAQPRSMQAATALQPDDQLDALPASGRGDAAALLFLRTSRRSVVTPDRPSSPHC